MRNQREKNLLILLGVLLAIAAWHYVPPMLGFGGPEPAQTTRSATDEEGNPITAQPALPGGARDERRGARPGDRVAELRLQDLDRVPREASVGRDPWRFIDPPPPKPVVAPGPTPEQLQAMEEARRRAEEAARLASAAAAAEAAKPKPPEFTLEYLGRFGPQDKKLAVFTDGKKELVLAEGSVIDNKFVVARIGYESVDIRFVEFPDWPAKRVGVRRK